MQIMCSGRVRYEDFIGGSGGLSGSAVEESSVAFEEKYALELEDLKSFEEDGLLEIGFDGFQVSSTGRLFTRNIATVFDEYCEKKMGKAIHRETVRPPPFCTFAGSKQDGTGGINLARALTRGGS